jgi:hypothetical protein
MRKRLSGLQSGAWFVGGLVALYLVGGVVVYLDTWGNPKGPLVGRQWIVRNVSYETWGRVLTVFGPVRWALLQAGVD